MPTTKLRWIPAVLAIAVGTISCSADLFHSTDWETKCQVHKGAAGCKASSASTGAGGTGGLGGASGAAGELSSATIGSGGTDGGGCYRCSQILAMQGAGTNQICHDDTSDTDWTALFICTCAEHCALECAATSCATQPPDMTCQACVGANCSAQYQACLNDL